MVRESLGDREERLREKELQRERESRDGGKDKGGELEMDVGTPKSHRPGPLDGPKIYAELPLTYHSTCPLHPSNQVCNGGNLSDIVTTFPDHNMACFSELKGY